MGSNGGEAADRPLFAIATAWKGLQAELGDGHAALTLRSFSSGCSLISPLFGCLGIAFKFAEKDYVAKVHDLCGAAKEYETLTAMIGQDIRNDTVRNGGSHTRNLLRVLRGVDMVRVLFEHILVTEGNSLKEPASKAYDQVFAPHHSWTIRKAVSAGMFMLPTKSQFLKKLHEEEDSARTHIEEFVKSATPVVEYVNNVFVTNELGTDW
ncbi:hypothetical protein M758_7G000500 [Ceratodon purpureus]|nr:hypothetical protein M758_7G000500 [Ceratodon purpureus]